MKNLKLTLGFLTLFSMFFLVSCQKDDQLKISTQETVNTTSQLNEHEANLLFNLNKQTPEISAVPRWGWWKKFKKIIAADFVGALNGANTGASVAGAVGGVSAGVGAVVGAVIGGAGASIAAGNASNASSNGGNAQNKVANGNNPYDDLGKHHNYYLQQYYPGFNCKQSCSNLIYNLGEEYVTTNFKIEANSFKEFIYEDMIDIFSTMEQINSTNVSDILKKWVKKNRITPIQMEVLNLYYNNILSLSTEDFYKESINFEDTILASSISESDKRAILIAISIGRYSRSFWVGE